MKILLSGSSGQLAAEFQKYFKKHNIAFAAPAEDEFDITDAEKVSRMISEHSPTHIINCAAYNQVDDAEDNSEKAFSINRDAVEILASRCEKNGISLVHFGTDYVFDGKKNDFYTEDDTPAPLNVYAESKLEGENKAKSAGKYLIFRVSWVTGAGTQNFLHKLSGWAQKSKTIKVSADEASIPTFTFDIAEICMRAVDSGLNGLYHLTNSGYASRYELAKTYAEINNWDNIIIPVSAESFKLKARRPLFTPMSNRLLSSVLKIRIPHWEESLVKYCKNYDK